ncbi:unnamed protein product [Durusdinium trenchii]|uniref:Hexosyltransferase n=1 Tax=Durusdinium trenchii TaxID=1381693 RepID=A0ABP0QEH3_9DINO
MVMEVDEDEGYKAERAYVALLHGENKTFLLYAASLGNRLRQLDADTRRVLLVGKSAEDHPAPQGEHVKSLSAIWEVEEVDLVDCPVADKSRRKRHRYVFTKLRCLEVPYRRIIFLDLDVIVRSSPAPLFEVPAPAGMYHGRWDRGQAQHGVPLPPEAFYDDGCIGCVNAGLLRFDPPANSSARRALVKNMLEQVKALSKSDESYLPEQYFMVKELNGWHHIAVAWNCEVNPEWFIQYGRGKRRAHSVLKAEMHDDWWKLGGTEEELRKNVHMFHFSGQWLQPWWYIHLDPEDAMKVIKKHYACRDKRGMIALAVGDWLRGIQELQKSDEYSAEQAVFQEIIDELKHKARRWWEEVSLCKLCKNPKEEGEDLCEECEVQSHKDDKENGHAGLPFKKCQVSQKKRSSPLGKKEEKPEEV